MNYSKLRYFEWTKEEETNELIKRLIHNFNIKFNEEKGRFLRDKYAITVGDELPSGCIEISESIHHAQKRKLRVGDKWQVVMETKGFVAKIVRDFQKTCHSRRRNTGDVVLNHVWCTSSRMNIGQIYETVLGWAGKELGMKFATPIFDGKTSTRTLY